MTVESQKEVIAFLQGGLGDMGNTLKSITTHISQVFLKKDRALKLKQAVRFAYVDYSTPALRLAACQSELELNRRTAPELYLGVFRITREPDGGLMFDGKGPLVDAVVEMRRFDENDLLDGMAQRGALTTLIMTDLARRIAAFHGAAPTSMDLGGAAGMAEVLDINDRSLRATRLVDDLTATKFGEAFCLQLANHAPLLDSRRAAGKVRRCHGDLILRNICLVNGVPTLFDCIEFSEPLATIDVLYDLSFVLMDLWHRDQADLANVLFNRYLDCCDETDGLALMPFFMAVRAAVRAHVTAAQAQEMQGDVATQALAEARAYLDLASMLLEPGQVTLVAVGGLSGAGKSTLAAGLASHLGAPPGARILNSDRIRKQLHGMPAEERLPLAAYSPKVSKQVFARLFDDASRTLATGTCVIADAVFDRPADRSSIEAVAPGTGIKFHGFWLEAPADTLVQRINTRAKGPSDATVDVLEEQLKYDTGSMVWHRVNSRADLSVLTKQVMSFVDPER
jgi:uncharacterized protein